MGTGIEVVADDGKGLFHIRRQEDGTLAVSCGGYCTHEVKVLEDSLEIIPKCGNVVFIRRKAVSADGKE